MTPVDSIESPFHVLILGETIPNIEAYSNNKLMRKVWSFQLSKQKPFRSKQCDSLVRRYRKNVLLKGISFQHHNLNNTEMS